MRQRVALLQSSLRRDFFVTTSKRNRLERQERNFLGIVEREPNNRAHLIVVDAVNKRRNQHYLDAGFVQVIDRTQLHIEEIADLTMAVRIVADTIELEVNIAQAGFGSFATEFFT